MMVEITPYGIDAGLSKQASSTTIAPTLVWEYSTSLRSTTNVFRTYGATYGLIYAAN